MPPKFQSSFIPQGAAPTTRVIPQTASAPRQHDILGFIAKFIFVLSILGAISAVGYKWYLNHSITTMSAELEAARQEVATGVTGELIRLNDRIVSTQALLDNHRVISPIFYFLQAQTPRDVRFTEFSFLMASDGPQVVLRGEAKSYAALSLEASILYKDKDFRNPVFSDIRLDEKGNVSFSVKSALAPDFISYEKTVGRLIVPTALPSATSSLPNFAGTTTATSSAGLRATTTATTTPKAKTATTTR